MIPKLILCDLDGTLLNEQKTVSNYTVQIIQKAREKGILFGLATGRSLYAVEHLIGGWGLEGKCDVLMGFNGGQIIDEALNVNEMNHPLKGEYILEIIHLFEDLDVDFAIYDKYDLYAYKGGVLAKKIADSNKFNYHVMENPEEYLKRDFPKVVLMCEDAVMQEVMKRAKTISNENYHGFRTGEILYEYVSPLISKSQGIRRICELHNISMEEVCVFGDAQNDIDMLQHCGLGVCMKNGTEETKAISDDITPYTNDEDGVAHYIEDHFL